MLLCFGHHPSGPATESTPRARLMKYPAHLTDEKKVLTLFTPSDSCQEQEHMRKLAKTTSRHHASSIFPKIVCVYVCMYQCMYVWMDGWLDG
jgi:hypothetical protein